MRRYICLVVAWAAALITMCAVFSRPLLAAWSFCLFVLGAALSPVLYELQDLALDRSNPLVKRGIELHQAAQELAKQGSRPWDVDPIVSSYFPAGTSFQDALTILRAAHASIEGPKLFVA